MDFILYIEVKSVWQQKHKDKADMEVCCKVLMLY